MAVNRRAVIIGTVVAGGALVGYEIYKHNKSKAAAATPAAGFGYGYGYGTPYGYGVNNQYAYSPYGYGASGGFPAGYYGYGTPTPPGSGAPSSIATTTNAQWDQAAITQLQQDGYDAATITSALGAYLNGQQVDSSAVNIIDAAIGIEGYPPVPAASGYPPAIKTGGTPGGGAGGGQTGGGTTTASGGSTVPNVVGQRADAALSAVKAAGFNGKTSPFRNPVNTYIVTGQNPAGNSSAPLGSTVTLNVAVHKY